MKRRVCLILAALLPLAGSSPALATVLKVSVAAGRSAPVLPAGAAGSLRLAGPSLGFGQGLPRVGLNSALIGISSPRLELGGPITAGAATAPAAAVPAALAMPVRAAVPAAKGSAFRKKLGRLSERITGQSPAKKETAAMPGASRWAKFFDGGLKHEELGEEPAGFADELRVEANAGIRTMSMPLAPAKPDEKPAVEEAPDRPEILRDGPPSPAARAQLRNYLIGTGIFKIGMESLGVSIPLLALTVYGSVTWAAVLAVGWGASQIVFSSLAGGLLDRKSPSRVLSWAMGLQGLTVAALLSLFLVDMYLPGLLAFKLASPYVLLALYSLAGGFMGVADTARQVIPPEIIGEREHDIKILNAKVHMAYETAGVIGALAAGAIITAFGLVPALILHPPAYLLAAYVFSKLKLGQRNARKGAAGESANLAKDSSPVSELAAGRPIRRAFSDLLRGAKTVWSKPIFRWSALALIIPLVLHRLLEGLMIPVAAKALLGNPAMAAWIIGASNAGELIGAVLLWRSIKNRDQTKRFRSHIWVRAMSLGVIGLWVFTLRPELWFILPLVAFGSMTWAASDLSLRSKLQNALPHRYRGRAFGFIGAVSFALILGASLGMGALMDTMAAAPVFLGINILLLPLALMMFYAGLKLRKPRAPKPSD